MNGLLVKGYDSNHKPFILPKENSTISKVCICLETTKLDLLCNLFMCCTCTKLIPINKKNLNI
jgi:hypothetical protein